MGGGSPGREGGAAGVPWRVEMRFGGMMREGPRRPEGVGVGERMGPSMMALASNGRGDRLLLLKSIALLVLHLIRLAPSRLGGRFQRLVQLEAPR